MRLLPAPGLMVRDPRTRQFIPAEGVDAALGDLALMRLLNAGDLVVAPTAPDPAAPIQTAQAAKAAPSPQPAAAAKAVAPTDEASA